MNKKIKECNEETTNYNETPRELLLEKLIMNELLNSKEFNTLLEITQEEFQKTFYPLTEIRLKEEKEIE